MADKMAPASGETSDFAENEMAVSELGEATANLGAPGFPPYPPYATDTAPPSVAETIIAGRDIRRQYKFSPQMPARPPPKPAKPRGPKATDVKMSKRSSRAHSRCMRRHGVILTDRLEYMAKPRRRNIIYLWREHANILPPETIARLRSMLDADEPFKPDQAYEYFVNLRKTKKKKNQKRIHQIKKDMMAICDDKRFLWARNATVAFARGIQHRLSKPGHFTLADGMLRLSDLILHDICRYMRLKTPARNSTSPKARFMLEMSDKIAVWIDEIISESDDRMLMMDFDEDEDVVADAAGDAGFADDFLNMMQGGGLSKFVQPAYKKFTGDILEAFTILTNAMYKKGEKTLTEYGKFRQTYAQAADTLKQTPNFDIAEINSTLAQRINHELSNTVKPYNTTNLATAMKDVVDMCSNYLAQHVTLNKDKGPAFKLLVTSMRKQSNKLLYERGKLKENYGEAAAELSQARSLESDHDDSDLSQEIHSKLSKLVDSATSSELKSDMAETLDVCSKYLSQSAVDKSERGPAFDILIKSLEDNDEKPFTTQFPALGTNYAAAHVLRTAPGLTRVKPNDETVPVFKEALHKAVDLVTPESQKKEMDDVIKRSANYLSGFTRDRGKAFKLLIEKIKKSPTKELVKRNNYTMRYGTAAEEIESAPFLTPYLPVNDISEEINQKLTKEMESSTPSELKVPMKTLIEDVSKHLSQTVALKSGAAGEKYPMDFLINVKKSMGNKPLYKYKGFGQTYAGAADSLKRSGVKGMYNTNENLQTEISTELKRTLPSKLSPTIFKELNDTIDEASRQLAYIGTKKGDALKHLTHLMKEKDKVPLAHIQGYEQTYGDAARRISNATSLDNENVDKPTYTKIKGKLKTLAEQNPLPQNTNELSEIVDECSEFLASPLPEDEMEKRRLLADLMARKDKSLLVQNGVFKLTYNDAGQEIIQSPVNVERTLDEGLKTEISQKINATVPEKRLQDSLKDTINGGSSHLANVIKGRGEVIQLIHDGMKKEKDKDFISIGNFNKTHEQAAEMLENATTFSSQNPSPVIVDKVSDRVRAIPIENISAQGKPHVKDAVDTVSKYIAGVATEECGLDAKALASLNDAAMSVKVADEAAGKSATAKGLDAKALASLNNADKSVKVGDEAAGKSTSAKRLDAKAVASLNNAEKSVKIGDEAAEKSISAKGLDAEALASLNNDEKRVKISDEAAEKSTSAKGLDAKALASLNNAEKSVKIGDEATGKGTSAKGLDAKALASLNNAEKSIEIGDEAAGKSTSAKGLDAKAFALLDNAEKSVKIGDEAAGKIISAKGLDAKALASLNNAEKSIDIGDETAGKSTSAQGLDAKALASLNNAEKSVKIGDEAAGKRVSAKGLDAKALESLNNAEKSVKIGDEAAGKGTSAKGIDPKALASLYKAEKSVKIGDEAAGKGTSAKGMDPKALASLNYAEKSVKIVDEAAGKSTPTKENKFVMEDSSKTTEKSDLLGKQSPKFTANVDPRKEVDPDREQALQILHSKLKARGTETFYKQPHNDLTHAQASEWLSKKPFNVDKSVKESADTARLHKKFERKLSALVATSTTPSTQDAMQDVIIETSRNLSEYFMSKSYNVLAREAVISEMQNRGNEILVEVDGAAESFFYSAQRLKKAKTLEAEKPCSIQYNIVKKLEEMIRSRGSLRKLTSHIKDYIHSAGEYLSERVTKLDEEIEAYVALLAEMEAAGDSPLVEGNIRKSYKEAAAYLRQLTSFEDQIKRDDNTLRKTIESKLGKLMANVTKTGYGKSDLDHVIHQNAVLLTSYIKLQGEKTGALKVLIEQMDKEGENVLLRHGNLRKTYLDGANILRTKNANQLNVVNADPVVSRKIQIKLTNLMLKVTPNQYRDLMDEVVHDVTNYLAVHFLQPEVIQVCKCVKNVFVQCELWCEEMLRRMNRPYCTCSRHVTTQQLADVCPNRKLYLSQSGSHLFASDLQISLTDCPSKLSTIGESSQPCPAAKPTTYCRSNTTASYVLYTSQGPFDNIPTKLSEADSLQSQILRQEQEPQFVSSSLNPRLPLRHAFSDHVRNLQAHQSTQKNASVSSESSEVVPSHKFWQSPTTMFAEVNLQTSNLTKKPDNELIPGFSKRNYQPKNVFSSRTPIITTDQMFDWHSMMVSLIWNVQAWRVWIQENINKVLAYHHNMELAESWADFQRTVSTEILQWHQYSTFSLQLTIRLASKYNNKKIISPTRTTVKTKAFLECHNEMLEIIDMFSKWTQWLTVIIKETDSLLGQNLYSQRWQILTEKVKEQIKDWNNYNRHLIYFWENKFKTLISDWIPGQPGAVWVMSACGAVPSGAVAAGVCDGEIIWVARTTHKCKILPAALYPSKHCCVLYTGGRTKHYTKYQVLCNARVQWVAFRAGAVPARAVRVGDVCVGRVRVRTAHLLGPVRPPRHRCHVAIFGRPFAFDCYELLVMDDDET